MNKKTIEERIDDLETAVEIFIFGEDESVRTASTTLADRVDDLEYRLKKYEYMFEEMSGNGFPLAHLSKIAEARIEEERLEKKLEMMRSENGEALREMLGTKVISDKISSILSDLGKSRDKIKRLRKIAIQ